jgi:hypothetical protein
MSGKDRMSRSQSVRAAFLLRRMRASRLLVGCVLLATLVTATLLAGLADFSAVFLDQAAEQQVASAGDLSVQVSSTASAAQSGAANRFVTASLRSAFGAQGLAMQSALWSDPLDLPTPAGSASQTIAEVASMGGIGKHVRLVAGAWPRSARPGDPYAVAVPAGDASKLGLRLGQSLTLTDADNGDQVRVQISGLYRIEKPGARYWGLDLISTSGVSVQGGFTTFGPLLTAAETFAPGRLPVGQRSWLATPVSAEIAPSSMPVLAGRVQQAVIRLGQSEGLGGIVASSGMPQLLTRTAASYAVARALLVIGGLELLLVAGAALALTAHLLASDRETESALLAARGLTRRQIALLAVVEAVTAAIVAAAAGVVLGGLLARLLAAGSSLRGVRPTASALSVAGLGAGWWPAIVVVALAAVVLGWPSASSATAAAHRASSGRPAVAATVSRVSVDVAILVLAALTAWQLRDYSAVAHGASGVLGVDPVLAVAPALILAGVALIPLRLMPAVARLADRLATRGSRLTSALAAWQLSRRPVRQAGPALLAILAVGASTLALAEEQSWRESIRAQAAAIVGADASVAAPPAGTPPAGTSLTLAALTARNVREAMPVTAFNGGLPGQVIALDAASAARVVKLRPDQAPLPAARLWRLISPTTRPAGLLVPGRAIRLGLQASLGRAPAGWGLGVLTASLSVQAADGVVYALPAGTLPADGSSHLLTAIVPAIDRVSYPLRLVGVMLAYQLPPVPADSATANAPTRQLGLTISGFAASGRAAGPLPQFASGEAISSWSRTAVSATLESNDKASGVEPAIGRWIASGSGSVTAVVSPGDGQLVPLPGLPPVPIDADVALAARPGEGAIPGIMTTSFASANSVGIGSEVVAAVGNYHVPVHVVAEVSSFPTVGTGSALIIDQYAVQAQLAAVSAPPLAVTSWWLTTSTGGPPATVRAGPWLTSLSQVTARMLDNPIGAAPQQIALAIAVAVAILATLGFAVSVASSLTERRASNALLAALGVSRRTRARQLCLEQVMLATPAAAVGLLAGAAIARLLVPAVTLTAAATRPTPPALVYLPMGRALALAAVVAVIPVLAAAMTVLSQPDPAAELRATGTA